jgi:hypothetical protein
MRLTSSSPDRTQSPNSRGARARRGRRLLDGKNLMPGEATSPIDISVIAASHHAFGFSLGRVFTISFRFRTRTAQNFSSSGSAAFHSTLALANLHPLGQMCVQYRFVKREGRIPVRPASSWIDVTLSRPQEPPVTAEGSGGQQGTLRPNDVSFSNPGSFARSLRTKFPNGDHDISEVATSLTLLHNRR